MSGLADNPGRVTVLLDGQRLAAHRGQSIASALIDAGVLSWRSTRRSDRPRGLFCGIGICFDCLITVDGLPDQRACLVPVADDMVISTGTESPVLDQPTESPEGPQ